MVVLVVAESDRAEALEVPVMAVRAKWEQSSSRFHRHLRTQKQIAQAKLKVRGDAVSSPRKDVFSAAGDKAV